MALARGIQGHCKLFEMNCSSFLFFRYPLMYTIITIKWTLHFNWSMRPTWARGPRHSAVPAVLVQVQGLWGPSLVLRPWWEHRGPGGEESAAGAPGQSTRQTEAGLAGGAGQGVGLGFVAGSQSVLQPGRHQHQNICKKYTVFTFNFLLWKTCLK